MKDTSRVIQDQRDFIKDKTDDGTLFNTVKDAANLMQEISDETGFTLEKLWTNWAALVTVLAAGSAGSWKTMIEESGRLLNDLRYTEDFVKLIEDLKTCFWNLLDLVKSVCPSHLQNFQILIFFLYRRNQLLTSWTLLPKSGRLSETN